MREAKRGRFASECVAAVLRRLSLFLCVVMTAVGGTGCSTPTPGSPDVGLTIESFTTTLAVGGKRFYSFTIPQGGTVSLTLLSAQVAGQPTDVTFGIGIGVPAGTDCTLNTAAVTGAGTTPQLKASLAAGLYCAAAYDVGNLTAPINFSINIVHPR